MRTRLQMAVWIVILAGCSRSGNNQPSNTALTVVPTGCMTGLTTGDSEQIDICRFDVSTNGIGSAVVRMTAVMSNEVARIGNCELFLEGGGASGSFYVLTTSRFREGHASARFGILGTADDGSDGRTSVEPFEIPDGFELRHTIMLNEGCEVHHGKPVVIHVQLWAATPPNSAQVEQLQKAVSSYATVGDIIKRAKGLTDSRIIVTTCQFE